MTETAPPPVSEQAKHLRVRPVEAWLPALRYDSPADAEALADLGAEIAMLYDPVGVAVRTPDGGLRALSPGDVVIAIETGRKRPVVVATPDSLDERFETRAAMTVPNPLGEDGTPAPVEALPLPPGRFLLTLRMPHDAASGEYVTVQHFLTPLVERIAAAAPGRLLGTVLLTGNQDLGALSEEQLASVGLMPRPA